MATPPFDPDPYRAALLDALTRIPVGPGWRCADIGTGTGTVSLALAALVGPAGRVWAVDHSPDAADELAALSRETGTPQVVPLVQSAEELALPDEIDLAWCRFLLMHVDEPLAVWRRMVTATRPGGFIVAQEPVTTAGRVGGAPLSMPGAQHPDIGASLPAFPAASGCALASTWAVAPVGAGPGPVASYLAELSGVDPGDDPIVLPLLVTVIARKPAAS